MADPPTTPVWARKLTPGEPVPPPPPALAAWANTTLAVTLAGTVLGGLRAHASRPPPASEVHPQVALQQYLIRLARGCGSVGVQVGSFAALFLGAQALLAAQRGQPDWRDTAAAGSATAGLFGLLCASRCLAGSGAADAGRRSAERPPGPRQGPRAGAGRWRRAGCAAGLPAGVSGRTSAGVEDGTTRDCAGCSRVCCGSGGGCHPPAGRAGLSESG